MKRSKVQFQKGFSLQDFIRQYGQEEQCRKAVFRAKWPNGWTCSKCGAKEFYQLASHPVYQCKQCHQQTSLIAETIFAATKLPLTTWFFAIFFITQAKKRIAALNIRRFLGISDRAALRMKQKLQLVMKNDDNAMKLPGLIIVDDVYHGGRSQGGKRGRGARGKNPVIATLSRNVKGYPINLRLSRVKAFSCEDVKKWAEQHLEPQSLVISDGLGCFNSFTDGGHIHFVRTTGDSHEPERIKPFNWLNIIIGNVKTLLEEPIKVSAKNIFHATRRNSITVLTTDFVLS